MVKRYLGSKCFYDTLRNKFFKKFFNIAVDGLEIDCAFFVLLIDMVNDIFLTSLFGQHLPDDAAGSIHFYENVIVGIEHIRGVFY